MGGKARERPWGGQRGSMGAQMGSMGGAEELVGAQVGEGAAFWVCWTLVPDPPPPRPRRGAPPAATKSPVLAPRRRRRCPAAARRRAALGRAFAIPNQCASFSTKTAASSW